jgi:hypothetical protein
VAETVTLRNRSSFTFEMGDEGTVVAPGDTYAFPADQAEDLIAQGDWETQRGRRTPKPSTDDTPEEG